MGVGIIMGEGVDVDEGFGTGEGELGVAVGTGEGELGVAVGTGIVGCTNSKDEATIISSTKTY